MPIADDCVDGKIGKSQLDTLYVCVVIRPDKCHTAGSNTYLSIDSVYRVCNNTLDGSARLTQYYNIYTRHNSV